MAFACFSPISSQDSAKDSSVRWNRCANFGLGNQYIRPSNIVRPTMMTSQMPTSPVEIPEHLSHLKVVGLGACGMDMVATVARFPVPDQKIRTTNLGHFGGGNCANTLTSIRRLGIACTLVAKIGDDSNGTAVLSELQRDGICTDYIMTRRGMATPFTYIIVDSSSSSRTCIHTPASEEVMPYDVDVEALLENVSLVVLDGRHTLAALRLAKEANTRNIPVLLDVERDRPHIRELVPCADFIVTNKSYPFSFAPDAGTPLDAMARLLTCGRAKAVITTAGLSGSKLLVRKSDAEHGRSDGPLLVTHDVVKFLDSGINEFIFMQCPSWSIKDVVDTTGAGDAFIGGVGYGICTGLDFETMLGLATQIAGLKIQKLGARTGLPRREELDSVMLTPLPRL